MEINYSIEVIIINVERYNYNYYYYQSVIKITDRGIYEKLSKSI